MLLMLACKLTTQCNMQTCHQRELAEIRWRAVVNNPCRVTCTYKLSMRLTSVRRG